MSEPKPCKKSYYRTFIDKDDPGNFWPFDTSAKRTVEGAKKVLTDLAEQKGLLKPYETKVIDHGDYTSVTVSGGTPEEAV
jgi:hypothetical protein